MDNPTYLHPHRNKKKGAKLEVWYFVAENGWYRAFVTTCKKAVAAADATTVVHPTHNQFCGALSGMENLDEHHLGDRWERYAENGSFLTSHTSYDFQPIRQSTPMASDSSLTFPLPRGPLGDSSPPMCPRRTSPMRCLKVGMALSLQNSGRAQRSEHRQSPRIVLDHCLPVPRLLVAQRHHVASHRRPMVSPAKSRLDFASAYHHAILQLLGHAVPKYMRLKARNANPKQDIGKTPKLKIEQIPQEESQQGDPYEDP